MKSSLPRIFLAILSTGTFGLALAALGGCSSDIITFAGDSKREGIKQYNDGNYVDAIGAFHNAIRQDPQDPETEYWLGLSYEQTQSNHQAIDAYKTTLKLMPNPDSVLYRPKLRDDAFDHLARVIAKSDVTDSETDLIVQTAAADKSAEQYQLLGRIARYRGDADTAMDDYHRSIRLDPQRFTSQKELGLYLTQMGQTQEAARVLRDAYRLNQDDKEVNDSLRTLGLVPGPGLLPQDQLARPALPRGPLPDLSAPAAHVDGPSADTAAPRE